MLELDKVYNMDCLEGFKQIDDNSIDLICTDPPYRVISGGTESDWSSGWKNSVLSNNDGKIFEYNNISFQEWMPQAYRVLKDDGEFYCMTNVINMEEALRVARECGFKLHNILVWEKDNATANRWYMKNCEFTLYFYKNQAKTINNAGSKQVHGFSNYVGNKLHPTEKPVELMELYVSNSSNKNQIVLDPFSGSGSTLVAAKELGRHFIGFEIDTKYYEVINHRLDGTNPRQSIGVKFDELW